MKVLCTITVLSTMLVTPTRGHFTSEQIAEGITFQQAMDEDSAGNLAVMECNEELLDCLADTLATTGKELGFTRDDPTSWPPPYDTWEHLCGAFTAQFDAVKCQMCATDTYPNIHDGCHPDERRLSGHVWQLFNGFKEERRRHLQEGSGFSDEGQSPRFQEPSVDATHRDLEMCLYTTEDVPYPVQSDFFYNILVGPLLLPFVLDVTIPDSPADSPPNVTVGAVLANFQSRTNQNNVASVMIVGKVLEFLIPLIDVVCEAIPDPICVGICGTNPFKLACFIIEGIAIAIVQIYEYFNTGIELHDGVVDGAEIFATLKNSEELIEASCQVVSDIDALSTLVTTETDQIDDFLDAGFCRDESGGIEFTSTCDLREQVTALAEEITRRFDRTDALLEAVRRLLITPQGRKRPGWNGDESCQDEDDCPIPPEIPAVAGGVASAVNFGEGQTNFFHD